MRRYILFIILNALAYTCVEAQSFCHLAQPVGTHYEDTIESAGTYYYSAWTFDLPMDVYITSLDPTCSEPPQVWADLTCTPGVYDDPNVEALVQDTAKYGISVPMSLGCETTFENGHYTHHLKLGKSYRNRLQLIGVDYNVEAYVKVVIPCAGAALMEQDTSSQACFRDARWLRLVDSTHVLANDTLISYIIPYKDWLNEADSMALYWEGTQDVRIWVAGDDCNFPARADAGNVWDFYDIPANGEIHLSKSLMTDAANNGTQDTAGFLYARVVCPEEGRLFTRPLIPDLKGSTLLRYNKQEKVSVADTAFYCFPTEWESVEWIANTRKVVKLYLYASPEEEPLDTFKFNLEDSTRRVLQWSKPEMNLIRQKTSSSLLYIRFECSRDSFILTPHTLDASSCVVSSLRLRPGRAEMIKRSQIIRLYYEDIAGYDMQICCANNNSNDIQNLFIADTCEFTLRWSTNATKKRCVLYKSTQRGGETWTVDSTTLDSWAERVTPEGYLYIRGTADGTITITNNKPEEQDPEGNDPEDEDPGEGGTTTGWFTIEPEVECKKVLHNGQIIIIRAGKAYSITGQVVKIE
ncbi:MAG: hypothetical protein IJ920_03360 [Paludibacteraceae bacterium]|nr:hypothetical protein [Paludibacteraceae bacterium]